MKFICIIFMILYFLIHNQQAVVQSAVQASHNVAWGARSSRDVLLSREIVVDKAKMLRVISTDYAFHQKNERFPHPRTITFISIVDQYNNGNGGYATLKSGGPSTDFAVIHLRSQRGHGYNFIIDIYGQ